MQLGLDLISILVLLSDMVPANVAMDCVGMGLQVAVSEVFTAALSIPVNFHLWHVLDLQKLNDFDQSRALLIDCWAVV